MKEVLAWGFLLVTLACTSASSTTSGGTSSSTSGSTSSSTSTSSGGSSSGCAAQDNSCCPAGFCDCTCTSGFSGPGYRPQCGYTPGAGCMYTDPCIKGLDADGGWQVCGL